MNALVYAAGWTLVDFLWQGALIGVATALALALLAPARPQLRYLVGCTGLLACLVVPALECVRLYRESQAALMLAGHAGQAVATAVVSHARLPELVQQHLLTIVVGWAICAGALALRMAVGLLWIGRAARGHENAPHHVQQAAAALAAGLGIARRVRVRVLRDLASPLAVGWLRPTILLPAALVTGMPPDLLQALLAHELAHIRRMDYLVNLVQTVIESLFFYHPAVWWLGKRVRAERELVADDLAASVLGEPRRLALALSELERIQFSHHHLAPAANGGDLMVRIKRLVKPEQQAVNWKAALPVLGIAALCLSLNTQARTETPASTKAVLDFRSCAKPQYPKSSLDKKETGTVLMGFQVNADGKVDDGRVVKSSGSRELDRAALDALLKCSFRPATKDGQPVATDTKVQYVWTLK
jgi:D-alanyl-D-alanine endopeptidase (penicillin-binding protein 7)